MILNISIQFFCLLTPFFVLSLFLDVCKHKTKKEKHLIALKTSTYIFLICLILLFFGNRVFSLLGITLLAFQIGSGIILLISGISMIKSVNVETRSAENFDDPSLIPLTLPVTVGPGTVGALFVYGNLSKTILNKLTISISLFIAVLIIFLLLYFSDYLEKILKKQGLIILSKLTGLFLAILATQSILNGIETFLKLILKR